MTLRALCRASSKMCTMPSAAIRRSDTRALSSSKTNTPGRWPIERHHSCPPQGVHSNGRGVADHRHDITMPARFGSQDTEPVLGVVVGDALDEAGHVFLGVLFRLRRLV